MVNSDLLLFFLIAMQFVSTIQTFQVSCLLLLNKRTQKETGKFVATHHPTSDSGEDLMLWAGYKTLGNHEHIVPKYASPASRLKGYHVDFYSGFSLWLYMNELVTAALNTSKKGRHENFFLLQTTSKCHKNASPWLHWPCLPLLSKITASATEAAGTSTFIGLNGCSSQLEHKNNYLRG